MAHKERRGGVVSRPGEETAVSAATEQRVRAMGLLDFLPWIALAMRSMRALMPLPDWTDGDGVRAWLGKLFGIFIDAAKKTKTTLDDEIADTLESLIADDAVWAETWAIISSLINGENIKSKASQQRVTGLAQATKIDIGKLTKIIETIMAIITMFIK